ncbi:MAG TPA: class I SAM-dependent methyltransferase [Candidatus Azoamicus sp. OHIO1]
MIFYIKKNINTIFFLKENVIKKILISTVKKNLLKRLNNPKKELLAKTVLNRNNDKYTIIDATGGLGTDSLILASLGHKIKLIEKKPIIIHLIKNNLKKNKKIKALAKNIDIKYGNSIEIISSLKKKKLPDIIYIDPIFPIYKKNSLPKKDISIIKLIGSNTNEYKELFNLALTKTKKIIVKRKIYSKFITNKKPTYQIIGSKIRFDIYQT